MTDTDGARACLPAGSHPAKVDEAAVLRHSFDLVHFPMYLSQRVAPRVRVEVSEAYRGKCDLIGCFEDARHVRTSKVASLIADEQGCVTGSEEFYRLVHAAFEAQAEGLAYVGFTRGGPPVYAPLFALAMLYRKFGLGIYRPGESLPTPDRALSFDYQLRLG